jgi:hypothetical protein
MNQNFDPELDDDLAAEYDFSQLPVVKRGPGRKVPTALTVSLDPDVAAVFATTAAVNEALRFLIRVTKDTPMIQAD